MLRVLVILAQLFDRMTDFEGIVTREYQQEKPMTEFEMKKKALTVAVILAAVLFGLFMALFKELGISF